LRVRHGSGPRGLRPYPVDVLIVDEAGQLALADAIASANAARNLILLGDPLQLAQVSQAEHPDGSGASVLEHVLGEHATIPRRSASSSPRPGACTPTSAPLSRTKSMRDASRATTAAPPGHRIRYGLRWIRAQHVDRSTESYEESALVIAQILSMIGTPWVNQAGSRRHSRRTTSWWWRPTTIR